MTSHPRVAIVSFPGTNCEVESIRAIARAGMQPVPLKWNDAEERFTSCDAFFVPGGFSYEDRGRAGMVAARDPVLAILRAEAAKGKVVIGHCNGAQILVESGLVPLGKDLRMSLAKNATKDNGGWHAPGFLNHWIWIRRSCARDRCAVSDLDEPLHMPIAHGEGRYVSVDPDVFEELKKNDQIAFQYCDEKGNVVEAPPVTPNGAMYAIAGICNPEGNVVALMPHPERTEMADIYFASMKKWIAGHSLREPKTTESSTTQRAALPKRAARDVEIFIDTIITNNEERTVEKAARRVVPSLRLKQMRYVSPVKKDPKAILSAISVFNPNKEIAYLRLSGKEYVWSAAQKEFSPVKNSILGGTALLRRDIPDTGASEIEDGAESGVCYVCTGIGENDLRSDALLEVFHNPHASTLEKI